MCHWRLWRGRGRIRLNGSHGMNYAQVSSLRRPIFRWRYVYYAPLLCKCENICIRFWQHFVLWLSVTQFSWKLWGNTTNKKHSEMSTFVAQLLLWFWWFPLLANIKFCGDWKKATSKWNFHRLTYSPIHWKAALIWLTAVRSPPPPTFEKLCYFIS
jgi:hypothetical protein